MARPAVELRAAAAWARVWRRTSRNRHCL